MQTFKSHKSIYSILKTIVKDIPLYFGLNFILTLLDGLVAPLMLTIVAQFIDASISYVGSNNHQGNMILYAGLIIIGYSYTMLSMQLKAWISKRSEDQLLKSIKPRLIKKIYSLDFLTYETAEVQDLINRVFQDANKRFIRVQSTFLSLTSILIQVVGTFMIISSYLGWYSVYIVVIMILLVYVSSTGGKRVYDSEKEVSRITRKMNYLSEILSNRESSHERTLFGYTSTLNNRYKSAHLFRSNYNTKALAREVARNKAINIVLNVLIILVMYQLLPMVSQQVLSIGLFTSMIGSMIVLSKVLSSQLSELFLNLASDQEYAKDLHAFSKLTENEDIDEMANKIAFESLVIKDLRFKYPSSDSYILKGINLSMHKGKSYSLVGLNGAGKTTLTKILTGLYRHYEGEILLNDVDLKHYSYGQLRQIFSVVSQDFSKYSISVEDNICFGQPLNKKTNLLIDNEIIDFVQHLPNKYDTELGKINHGGVDLSGGQWQRLAITRALYRNTAFIIMDEPTSALSPSAESAIYSSFLDFAKERSLLMISHRLGSTKIADEIIVMDNGVIEEVGTHDELMKDNHHYAKLFRKQSRLFYEKN